MFALYFTLALLFFAGLSYLIVRVLDAREERKRRHFKQKVDRYRRGNR